MSQNREYKTRWAKEKRAELRMLCPGCAMRNIGRQNANGLCKFCNLRRLEEEAR